ncbi:hypothetical protein TNCV_4934871 [Trichonephila clavipes]|uniref:RNase H type-1 domain-containing protein n=1 Tax=Trichonephila clavipes TaxID=2585209 RepID=A0A8X6SSK6_TRICX|nr:hypothetical protein TNCV_4934871 [Trichonephila clavipes]
MSKAIPVLRILNSGHYIRYVTNLEILTLPVNAFPKDIFRKDNVHPHFVLRMYKSSSEHGRFLFFHYSPCEWRFHDMKVHSHGRSDHQPRSNCRTKDAELISYGWTVGLQWIPSHVGIPGNDRADEKTSHGAESSQTEVPLTSRRANNISTCIDKYITVAQETKSLEEP